MIIINPHEHKSTSFTCRSQDFCIFRLIFFCLPLPSNSTIHTLTFTLCAVAPLPRHWCVHFSIVRFVCFLREYFADVLTRFLICGLSFTGWPFEPPPTIISFQFLLLFLLYACMHEGHSFLRLFCFSFACFVFTFIVFAVFDSTVPHKHSVARSF